MTSASISRRMANLIRPRPESPSCLTVDEWMNHVEKKIEASASNGGGSGGQLVPSVYRAEIAARLRAAGYRVHESAEHNDHLSIHWAD